MCYELQRLTKSFTVFALIEKTDLIIRIQNVAVTIALAEHRIGVFSMPVLVARNRVEEFQLLRLIVVLGQSHSELWLRHALLVEQFWLLQLLQRRGLIDFSLWLLRLLLNRLRVLSLRLIVELNRARKCVLKPVCLKLLTEAIVLTVRIDYDIGIALCIKIQICAA